MGRDIIKIMRGLKRHMPQLLPGQMFMCIDDNDSDDAEVYIGNGAGKKNIKLGAKGDKGDKGDNGADGRDGINGTNGKDGKDGVDGRGISSIRMITNNTESGAANTIEITFTDGGTERFTVYNGGKGEKGDTGAKGDKGDKGEKGDSGELVVDEALTNLKHCFNCDDTGDCDFEGDVLRFGSSGHIMLDDEYALRLNGSGFSGYKKLADMAEHLVGVKEVTDKVSYDSDKDEYNVDFGNADVYVDGYVKHNDDAYFNGAVDLNPQQNSGYGSIAGIAGDVVGINDVILGKDTQFEAVLNCTANQNSYTVNAATISLEDKIRFELSITKSGNERKVISSSDVPSDWSVQWNLGMSVMKSDVYMRLDYENKTISFGVDTGDFAIGSCYASSPDSFTLYLSRTNATISDGEPQKALSDLNTADKSSLIAAINELAAEIASLKS